MTKNWTPLAITWLVLAIVGLIGTWTFNTVAIIQRRDFIGDWVNSGPAVSSLTVDLLVVAVAGSILIIIESRRLGMKRAWLYIVLSGLTAFAFTFPLFLAMRERKLVSLRVTSLQVS
jgi:Terpene cyclase DEP1